MEIFKNILLSTLQNNPLSISFLLNNLPYSADLSIFILYYLWIYLYLTDVQDSCRPEGFWQQQLRYTKYVPLYILWGIQLRHRHKFIVKLQWLQLIMWTCNAISCKLAELHCKCTCGQMIQCNVAQIHDQTSRRRQVSYRNENCQHTMSKLSNSTNATQQDMIDSL